MISTNYKELFWGRFYELPLLDKVKFLNLAIESINATKAVKIDFTDNGYSDKYMAALVFELSFILKNILECKSEEEKEIYYKKFYEELGKTI